MPGITVKDVDQDMAVPDVALFRQAKGPGQVQGAGPERSGLVLPLPLEQVLLRAITQIYGGRKRNGVRPSHFCRADGSVARKAVQALEAIKLIEKHADGGRKLTSQGQRDLDRIAAQIVTKQRAALKKEAATIVLA